MTLKTRYLFSLAILTAICFLLFSYGDSKLGPLILCLFSLPIKMFPSLHNTASETKSSKRDDRIFYALIACIVIWIISTFFIFADNYPYYSIESIFAFWIVNAIIQTQMYIVRRRGLNYIDEDFAIRSKLNQDRGKWHIVEQSESIDPDKKLLKKIVTRFGALKNKLGQHGFEHGFFVKETLSDSGKKLLKLVVPFMLFNREIVSFKGIIPQSLVVPVLIHKSTGTYGVLSGITVNFYTLFTDGTLLVTKTRPGKFFDTNGVMTYPLKVSPEEAWLQHENRINKMLDHGAQIDKNISFENYKKFTNRHQTEEWSHQNQAYS